MKLWSAQTLAQLEATVVDFTIAVVIADAVKETGVFGESATALVFALQFIPALPASLFAGVIADIVDRRLLMFVSNVFRSAFLLLFVFAAEPGAHLYIFVFVMAIFMHSYDIFEKSTIRNVTHKEELSLATGLFLFTMNATTLVGVIAAGFLKNTVGLRAVLLSGALMYAIAAILIYKLPKNINNFHVDHYENDENVFIDTQKALKRLFSSLKESITYTKKYPPVWLSMVLVTIVQTVMLVIASVSFRFGGDVLGISSAEVSIYLLIPVAIGLAVGSALSPLFVKFFSYRSVILTSWFVGSILLGVIASIGFLPIKLRPELTFEFALFEVLIVTMGALITMIQAPGLEMIQRFANPKIRGRVFGILVGATNTVSGILVAVSGIALDALRATKSDTLGSSKFLLSVAVVLLISMLVYSVLLKKKLGKKDFIEYEEPTTETTGVVSQNIEPLQIPNNDNNI